MRKEAIDKLLRGQFGVLSRPQAVHAGLSRRSISHRVKAGEWVVLLKGVYRSAAFPDSWQQGLMAAQLWAGEVACVSHRAAAGLWKLEGVPSGVIELTLPAPRHRPGGGIILHSTDSIRPGDVTGMGPLRVTEVGRTLLDLGSVVVEEVLDLALEDALRRGLTSLTRLRWLLHMVGTNGRRGAAPLRKVIEGRKADQVTESMLEARLLRLIRKARLSEPVSQHEVRAGGRLVARVDFAYPDLCLALEADGYKYHSGREAFHRDRSRLNDLVAMGWKVLRFTWEDVTARPGAVVSAISSMTASSAAGRQKASPTAKRKGDRAILTAERRAGAAGMSFDPARGRSRGVS